MTFKSLYPEEKDIFRFDCICGSREHNLEMQIIDDPELPFMGFYVFLDSPGFFKRIWKAIKYVFGYKCRYGHWDEILLDNIQVQKMRKATQEFLQRYGEEDEETVNKYS